MSDRPITEEDLHAYVDDALDAVRRGEVEAYLARHPDAAARVSAFAEQRQALRSALAPFAEEPVPPELDLARIIAARRRPSRSLWRSAAAAVLLFALGAAGGWFMHQPAEPAGGIAALAQEAAANYAVYAPDYMHPVELKAADSGELLRWVSERLHRPVTAPDLSPSGYRFMGGRLVATAHGPAALFLYDDDHGTRLAMLIRPMAVEGKTPMSEHAQGPLSGFAWADRGLGYSLVADASPQILHPLADEARRQIESKAAG
ncbi:MAG TPA: anti-sigma factor [Stellaceae bacterium]|nr:anti-sigma factor [Stellaceae bacterium]